MNSYGFCILCKDPFNTHRYYAVRPSEGHRWPVYDILGQQVCAVVVPHDMDPEDVPQHIRLSTERQLTA